MSQSSGPIVSLSSLYQGYLLQPLSKIGSEGCPTNLNPMLPSPEVIRETPSVERPLPIEPWVAAGLSRLWQAMKKHIEQTTVADSSARGQAHSSVTSSSADTQAQRRNDQSAPASSHNRS